MFAGKHILIGVTGGIAAYKIPSLVRLLKKEGAEVRVVMTPDAREFVAPLTLSVLSENPVFWTFTDEEALDQGVLINVTQGNIVRLLPPLTLTDSEADKLTESVINLIRR